MQGTYNQDTGIPSRLAVCTLYISDVCLSARRSKEENYMKYRTNTARGDCLPVCVEHTADKAEGTLAALRPGESACCAYIDPQSPLGDRLGDLGLRAGVTVLCERRSLFGDPSAYRLQVSDGDMPHAGGGCVIALRRADAVRIRMSPLTEKNPARCDARRVGALWD